MIIVGQSKLGFLMGATRRPGWHCCTLAPAPGTCAHCIVLSLCPLSLGLEWGPPSSERGSAYLLGLSFFHWAQAPKRFRVPQEAWWEQCLDIHLPALLLEGPGCLLSSCPALQSGVVPT